ncbi:hypothetical protein ACLB2K_027053 [Fragaria x ananassa]
MSESKTCASYSQESKTAASYSHQSKISASCMEERKNPKQTYYLSMEYLQGRALTNAIGNLNVQSAYAEALNKLGHDLENITEQEKDAALGNGGLGRLASCFLDSMATLNLPAWGYGLRYRYGLFKQRIAKDGQEETAEDWLEKFSPWEVVRHDVVYPVRFFGRVHVNPDGSRKWVEGEILQALAYDVPIPGYKTKNTISLRLWDAKACSEDFNLFQFNDGQYESAAQLHSRAQQEMSPEERKKATPRTVMIGGKAFATYTNAKRIVKLVNDVGAVVNTDPEVNSYLKVVFVPNYIVSVAELLIPGSELSQHISTAGMEASGTSNMKFALNGCLIIGILDGANVEIREEVGQENFFLFGATADEVPKLRKDRENGLFKPDPRFEEAKKFIRSGAFGSYDYHPLLDSLEGNSGFGRADYFLVGHDFAGYSDAQARVDEAYKDKKKWFKSSILSTGCTAGSGKFSSDRTIAQYAMETWKIEECRVP